MDTILISFNSDATNLYSILLLRWPPENACFSLNVNKKKSLFLNSQVKFEKKGAKEIPFK